MTFKSSISRIALGASLGFVIGLILFDAIFAGENTVPSLRGVVGSAGSSAVACDINVCSLQESGYWCSGGVWTKSAPDCGAQPESCADCPIGCTEFISYEGEPCPTEGEHTATPCGCAIPSSSPSTCLEAHPSGMCDGAIYECQGGVAANIIDPCDADCEPQNNIDDLCLAAADGTWMMVDCACIPVSPSSDSSSSPSMCCNLNTNTCVSPPTPSSPGSAGSSGSAPTAPMAPYVCDGACCHNCNPLTPNCCAGDFCLPTDTPDVYACGHLS